MDLGRAEVGFFPTRKPNFSPRTGVWSEVVPRQSFQDGASGAIELAARYESLDLGQELVAGSGNDADLALNWFLTHNLRAILDWVHWNVTDLLAPYTARDRGDSINVRLDTSFWFRAGEVCRWRLNPCIMGGRDSPL